MHGAGATQEQKGSSEPTGKSPSIKQGASWNATHGAERPAARSARNRPRSCNQKRPPGEGPVSGPTRPIYAAQTSSRPPSRSARRAQHGAREPDAAAADQTRPGPASMAAIQAVPPSSIGRPHSSSLRRPPTPIKPAAKFVASRGGAPAQLSSPPLARHSTRTTARTSRKTSHTAATPDPRPVARKRSSCRPRLGANAERPTEP